MTINKNPKYRVYGAVIDDLLSFENAEPIVIDGGAAIARTTYGTYKCLLETADTFFDYKKKYGITGEVCLMNAPLSFADKIAKPTACKTYAYFAELPPRLDGGADIRRLAPSLAPLLAETYSNPGGKYTTEHMEKLIREKGVFGLLDDGNLAGFIGRHDDGDMGMLHVFEKYRRKGYGQLLEKFLITYVMTFSRVPHCDVVVGNDSSKRLQEKLGLQCTQGDSYTFWFEV